MAAKLKLPDEFGRVKMCLTCFQIDIWKGDTSEAAERGGDSDGEIEGRQISRWSEFGYQRQENEAWPGIKLPFIKQWNESMDFKRLGVTLVRVNLAFINRFRKWILQFANCIQS